MPIPDLKPELKTAVDKLLSGDTKLADGSSRVAAVTSELAFVAIPGTATGYFIALPAKDNLPPMPIGVKDAKGKMVLMKADKRSDHVQYRFEEPAASAGGMGTFVELTTEGIKKTKFDPDVAAELDKKRDVIYQRVAMNQENNKVNRANEDVYRKYPTAPPRPPSVPGRF